MRNIRVGIRDAKIHLGRYLKLVQKGKEVILTDHGKPVGKIVPVTPKDLSLPIHSNGAQRLLQEDRDGHLR